MEWKIASQKTIKGRRMKEIHEPSSDIGQLFEEGYPSWYQDLADTKEGQSFIDGFGLSPGITKEQRVGVENLMKKDKTFLTWVNEEDQLTYGYNHACPTNLGTGMRASVHIHLPGWTKLHLQPRGTRGESGGQTGVTYSTFHTTCGAMLLLEN